MFDAVETAKAVIWAMPGSISRLFCLLFIIDGLTKAVLLSGKESKHVFNNYIIMVPYEIWLLFVASGIF